MREINKTPEYYKPADYTSKEIQLDIRLTDDVIANLPEITSEQIENKREHFRALLGRVEVSSSGQIGVSIEAILDMENDPSYYSEGEAEVTGINLQGLKRVVANVGEKYPEFAGLELVGDIHTHPVVSQEDGVDLLSPSDNDIEDIIAQYDNGVLSSDKPYIFGIAAVNNIGETEYSFYRLVKEAGDYKVENIRVF